MDGTLKAKATNIPSSILPGARTNQCPPRQRHSHHSTNREGPILAGSLGRFGERFNWIGQTFIQMKEKKNLDIYLFVKKY